ncbi:hypothetical protein FRC02_006845 [Tulasnella sp. 418]|nr:hypothetical protein FRC02_006845 [Tulasnella sp. 418]
MKSSALGALLFSLFASAVFARLQLEQLTTDEIVKRAAEDSIELPSVPFITVLDQQIAFK